MVIPALGLLLQCALGAAVENGSFSLSGTIGSHMVLQASPASARLWGWGRPGDIVQLRIDSEEMTTTATVDSEGTWSMHLKPRPASPTAHNLTFSKSNDPIITLTDVLFGEVWLCTGQSNMALPLQGVGAGSRGHEPATSWSGDVTDGSAEVAEAGKYAATIRIVQQRASSPCLVCIPFQDRKRCTCSSPQKNTSAVWLRPNPQSVGTFSAVCWMYGRRLQQKLGKGIPVGLIEIAVGGTAVELWSSDDARLQCDQRRGPFMALCQDPSKSSMRTETTYTNGTLFNMMTSPWTNMAVRGAVWYQGESNVACSEVWPYFQGKNCAMDASRCADYYQCQFPAMIKDLRNRFSAPWKGTNTTFSFLFVQLPAYIEDLPSITYGGYNDSSLPLLRLAQARALIGDPHTGMVSIVDHGWLSSHYGSIHPMDKTPVAERLVVSSMHIAYGRQEFARSSGPTGPIVSHTESGTKLRVNFSADSIGPKGLLLRTEGAVRQVCPVGKRQTTALPVEPTTPVPRAQCGSRTGFEVRCRNSSTWLAIENISLSQPDKRSVLLTLPAGFKGEQINAVRYLFADWPWVTVYGAESIVYASEHGQMPAPPFLVHIS